MPPYHHFVDAPDNSYRLFFEEEKSRSEVKDVTWPNKRSYRNKSGYNTFRIYGDGQKLVGKRIAETFAILVAKRIKSGLMTCTDQIIKIHSAIKHFFHFLSRLATPPKCFSDINILHFSKWLDSFDNKKCAISYKGSLRLILSLHPESASLNISSLKLMNKRSNYTEHLNQIDLDLVVRTHDYSDKVLFQLLAFAYFEIALAEARLAAISQATIEELGDDYLPLEQICTNNEEHIKRLLESGEEGFKKLMYHYLLHFKGIGTKGWERPSISVSATFNSKLRQTTRILYEGKHNPFDDYMAYYQSSQPQAWPLSEYASSPVFEYISLTSKHHEVAIFLYALIVTGVNKEVALTWQWAVNGKPWFENYDVQLGIHKNTISRDKRILLLGTKRKGGMPKKIIKSISINSPLYKYLRFLDKTRTVNRQYIFDVADMPRYLRSFLAYYNVFNDDTQERLTSIETRRIRKSFIGHKTFSLLENVGSADELVTKLKDALNHKSFDTTFSSYIMKSGMGRAVIDSAIVALTTDMLEQAMRFSGEIKEDSSRKKNNNVVFLCDCNDPMNPSHGYPIAERCTRYDLCLGCTRSEVYAEHLPAIIYRVLQYEEKLETEPEVFKAILADRLQIARDTIEQFKKKHSKGLVLVENAYITANKAMRCGEPLLPPIIQGSYDASREY